MINTRSEIDTAKLLPRLDAALHLIARYQPRVYRRLSRDIARFVVRRFVCRGGYFSKTRTCLVELTFLGSGKFTDAQIAASIVHEATHGRLHRLGLQMPGSGEERLCRQAELRFGQALPDGAVVIARAEDAIAGPDDEVAPIIDWALARRRAEAADLEATPVPRWVKRFVARVRGLELPLETHDST
jgi:hypothetical protein